MLRVGEPLFHELMRQSRARAVDRSTMPTMSVNGPLNIAAERKRCGLPVVTPSGRTGKWLRDKLTEVRWSKRKAAKEMEVSRPTLNAALKYPHVMLTGVMFDAAELVWPA